MLRLSGNSSSRSKPWWTSPTTQGLPPRAYHSGGGPEIGLKAVRPIFLEMQRETMQRLDNLTPDKLGGEVKRLGMTSAAAGKGPGAKSH